MSSNKVDTVKLKEISIKITDGTHSTVKDDESGEYFLLSCKNIKSGEILITEKDRKINKETFDKLRRRTNLQINDTLITTVGTIGESALVKYKPNNIEFQRSVAIIRPDVKKVFPEYLYYCTRNRNFIKQAQAFSKGSVQRCLFLGAIEELEISMFSLEEQIRISSILASIDKKIENNNQINKKLEEMAQAIFKQWFVDFEFPNEDGEPYKSSGGEMVESEMGIIPKGWSVCALYDLAEYINGTSFKKDEVSESKGIPIIKIAELKQGISNSTKYCVMQKDKKYYLDNGDILFSWSGNPETSIDTFIWHRGDGVLNQHTFKVVSEEFSNEFMYIVLKYYKPIFIQIASNKQTTGLGHVTVSDLKRLKITLPHDEIMNTISLKINSIVKSIHTNNLENVKLSNIRDLLLPKLMSGEVRVSTDN